MPWKKREAAAAKAWLRTAVMGLGMAAIAACRPLPVPEQAAELILANARVYTVDAANPWAQAVAIRDGRIVAVGSEADLAPWTGPDTRVVDLDGRLVMPAFGDAHVHPVFGGLSHSRCSLHAGESVEAYARIIAECVAETPGSGTVYGVGWSEGAFPPTGIPHKDVLDAISTDRALIFLSTGGHSLWLNSRALEIAGITRDTPDPVNGVIDRDPATGEPIGGLQETAMALVHDQIPPPTQREVEDAIAYAARHFNRLGITAWHDAGVDVLADGSSPVLDAYRAVRDRGELTLHTSIALGSHATQWQDEASLDLLPVLFDASARARADGLAADSVKLYLDGVIVQRTAAMLEPYEDSGDERGHTQIPEPVLKEAVNRIDAHGMQVHVHAIGDRAVRLALDALEVAGARNGETGHRHMISHLNVIDPDDQTRFGALGVTAVFQPLWACDEPYMRLSIDRIGERRKSHIYPTNGILQSGGRVAYGADWPVASANPFEGLEVALTRIAPGVRDLEPLLPEQRVTLAEAVEAYTLNVARVLGIDGETGSIEEGKSADLIVVDRNIFDLSAHEVSKAQVLLTLFEGEAVSGDIAAFED